MIRRILLAAIVAGAAAGVFAHGAQMVEVVPLIHQAEVYEDLGHDEAHGNEEEHADLHAGWEPADGFERQFYTLSANVLTGVAFGLLLVAAFTFSGREVDWKRGIVWGLAGYAVFSLAPSLGLPPATPGMEMGAVGERQVWWLGAVVATAGGLALIVFAASKIAKTAGALLIAAPHVIGAPQPHELGTSPVPAELAAQYVVATLVASLAFWAVLGGLAGHFFSRWVQSEQS